MGILAHRITLEQLDELVEQLRATLCAAGLDKAQFDAALETAMEMMLESTSAEPVFSKMESSQAENRGVDSLGRLLVEYCFFEGPDKQMIWPDNSFQDVAARKMFIPECVSRPLMRYFLASVRGAVPGLDNFEAESILALHEDMSPAKHAASIKGLLEEFKGPFGEGEDAIEWEAVYADNRCRTMALAMIRDILTRLQQLGHEQYLDILMDLRGHDPDNNGINAMQRPLVVEDIEQIETALKTAETMLAELIA